MCGILACSNIHLKQSDIEESLKTLSKRGPDNSDCFYDSENLVWVGHTRLSIIDLDERANQPMRSKCERYFIVYNGEVYNFKELQAKYHLHCNTTSDTEVILELFAEIGPSVFEEFNGMFSIVIYDKKEGEIYLFRDRLGIKPLFYYWEADKFVVASELKAIIKLISDLEADESIIATFLSLGYIPTPFTWYKNVAKFPQGSWGLFNKHNQLEIKSYWKLEEERYPISSSVDYQSTLAGLIDSSVKMRMIADVPVGSFLSGGVDSSTVTAFAQKHSDRRLRTFTIGIKDSKVDERNHAKAVAQYLDTEHTEYVFSEKDLMEKVSSILDIYDEPFADSSVFPTLLVSKVARSEVKVVLSGDGGDEQFMGYNAYSWANRLGNPLIYALRKLLASGLELTGRSRFERVSHLLKIPSKPWSLQHIFSQEQYLFSNQELCTLLKTPSEPQLLYPLAKKLSAQEQANFDLLFYLPDDLLVKVDRASMYHSLEARVPLLDHRIVEFTQQLPNHLKVHKGVTKYLLRKVLYEQIPEKYFQHPKWGFGIPLHRWLRTDLGYLIEGFLSEKAINQTGIFDVVAVKNLVNRFRNGTDYLYNRIWVLILVQKMLLGGR